MFNSFKLSYDYILKPKPNGQNYITRLNALGKSLTIHNQEVVNPGMSCIFCTLEMLLYCWYFMSFTTVVI